MKNDKKIIAIIPARGGSKEIPRKNIKPLVRKPLIAHTIEAALESKYLDMVIVSTEDEEIAKISKKYGAEVKKRSKKLSTDTAKIIDVVLDLLNTLKTEKYQPEIIVLLQPTSPLRTVDDIDRAIETFLKNKCGSVISVCETEQSPYWDLKVRKKYLKPLLSWKYFKMRRQDLDKVYTLNGAIYVTTTERLVKYKSFYGKKILPYIMPKERSVDIDSELDFGIVNLMLKLKNENKNRK